MKEKWSTDLAREVIAAAVLIALGFVALGWVMGDDLDDIRRQAVVLGVAFVLYTVIERTVWKPPRGFGGKVKGGALAIGVIALVDGLYWLVEQLLPLLESG